VDEQRARLGRRAFLGGLAAAAGAAVAACSSPARTAAGTTTASTPAVASSSPSTAAATPSPSATPTPSASGEALPAVRRWAPRAGEVEPAVKGRAVALVEAVAGWSTGQGGLSAARRRVAALGLDPALADACAPLLGEGTAAVCQVVDAQYGGILSTTSSVLVVVDQWRRRTDGSVVAGGTTLDVRLVAASPQWRVVAVYPARPGAASAALPSTARDVLGSTRIRLPYAAAADVRSGAIHASVLTTLLALADRHLVDVSVVRSGHPLYVFGTSRLSDHPRGRAVDVWALDGRALVVPANHGLAVQGMELAVSRGAYNVGGPVLLAGPQYFSDRTHHDHIHLGFAS
jgi:hypothetical protein